ncbi:hypothetical protein ACSHWB_21855 [Lentzea sp. HUAS TT2]|uniref:hypothetical protein n=1 Tax=Lentzea sp. HUAS TT2 TaxID=3447454 RepID=UPI003F6FB73A
MPLVLLALLGIGVWQGYQSVVGPPEPDVLRLYQLDGPRGPTCLRLAIAMDVSGSMAEYAAARDSALVQLRQWATEKNTLRADDEMAIVDFAGGAITRLPPTPVAHSTIAPNGSVPDGNNTLLRPMLDEIGKLPVSSPPCDTVLLLLSDAQLADLPPDSAAGAALLRQAGVHDIRFLVPGDGIDVPAEWSRAFPSAPPIRFDGLDDKETALTIGKTIAELTRQRLVPVTRPSS